MELPCLLLAMHSAGAPHKGLLRSLWQPRSSAGLFGEVLAAEGVNLNLCLVAS